MSEEATTANVGDALAAYQAGRYDSAQLIHVLTELTWSPAPRTTGLDDDYLPVHPWDLIVGAHRDGLVDDDLYDTAVDAIEAGQRQKPKRP